MRLFSRWRPCLFLLSLPILLALVGCGDAIPEPAPTSQATPLTLATPTASPPCLAIPQELWEEETESLATLQRSYPTCPLGLANDSSQALAWLGSGGSQLAVVSGEYPQQGAELIRTEPFALVAHVTSPLDDVSLAWLQDVFE